MDPCALPAVDLELPGLMKQAQACFAAGDESGLAGAAAAIGAERLMHSAALVGALCLGGTAFAVRLVTLLHPGASPDQAAGAVLDGFNLLMAPPAEPTPDFERQVMQAVAGAFALEAEPDALLDLLRADFLIALGPTSELTVAIQGAIKHGRWALALSGLQRLRQELGARAPRRSFGLAAMCLHRLGRYAEADEWAAEGLGDAARLISPLPVFTQDELLARWGAKAHQEPVVSIICTTYNHERYIESTIRGFLGQACDDPFEILIHDDASTDRTQEVIRRWQERYPAIIRPVLQVENQKSRGARPFELMLARARGRYVATCEGDDYWIDPAKLQRQVSFLEAHPDFSCTTHNYYHFVESTLAVTPWRRAKQDFAITPRQLMGARWLLWLPTLVFRKTFSSLPPERDLAAFGDQFLTSYLGTFGRGMYFETQLAAVRRENAFSTWSPLPETEKERRRVKTWVAMIRMHQRLGHARVVDDLMAKFDASSLDPQQKAALLGGAATSSTVFQPSSLAAA